MLAQRKTTYILLAINFALVLFVFMRSGSDGIPINNHFLPDLTIEKLRPSAELPGDTIILNDFEKKHELHNMYPQGGEYQLSLGGSHVSHGRLALIIEKEHDSNIEFATTHFRQDWRGYDTLFINLYNDDTEEATFWLRIGDRFDGSRFFVESQKYAVSFRLHPGENNIAIAVSEIFDAFGYPPERISMHFNFPAGTGRRLILDYLRLVRYDGSI